MEPQADKFVGDEEEADAILDAMQRAEDGGDVTQIEYELEIDDSEETDTESEEETPEEE